MWAWLCSMLCINTSAGALDTTLSTLRRPSPPHIKPFPKALPRKNNTQRPKMSSVVLTDTQVQQQIEKAAAKQASSTQKQAVGKMKPVVRKRPLPTPETSDREDEGVAPVEPDTGDEYSEEEPEADRVIEVRAKLFFFT